LSLFFTILPLVSRRLSSESLASIFAIRDLSQPCRSPLNSRLHTKCLYAFKNVSSVSKLIYVRHVSYCGYVYRQVDGLTELTVFLFATATGLLALTIGLQALLMNTGNHTSTGRRPEYRDMTPRLASFGAQTSSPGFRLKRVPVPVQVRVRRLE